MSTFDLPLDTPSTLRFESLNITLSVSRTSPTTARISWNIPTPAAGCTADQQAYCGIVITGDTTGADQSKIPQDGKVYSSDPTMDRNLFAGDKIGTSFVLGAFYQDKTTTFLDVSGLTPNSPFYVTGFPTDCVFRYFIEGVHAYSLDFKGPKEAATSATQVVSLFSMGGQPGIKPTDYTGLVPGVTYQFITATGTGTLGSQPQVPLPPSACIVKPIIYTVTIKGEDAQTFQDLADAINKQFGLLSGCPHSPLPPNAGTYFWNATTQKLYLWDGFNLLEQPVFVQPTAPNFLAIGSYWLNTANGILYRWDGTQWVAQTVITYPSDPTAPICDSTIWFDGTTVHLWNGLAWCDTTLFTSTFDPSVQQPAPCGAYWFRPSINQMYKWDDKLDIWLATLVIKATQDPNAFADGFYWFNSSTNQLLARSGLAWVAQVNVRIQETQPTLPGPGTYWYNPVTQVLQQWNGLIWVILPDVTTFATDPTNRSSCDLWWNTATNLLYVWDKINSVWVQVVTFFQQEIDPTIPPTIIEGSYWLNPVTMIIYIWINGCWVTIPYINFPTDPIQMITGTVWFDGTTWRYWNGAMWVVFIPTISAIDPSQITAGALWFNTTNNTLNMWNGASWVNILYITTSPVPTKGTCWYDETTNMVRVWDGTQWVPGNPIATVEIDCNGNFLFTDSHTGSTSFISVDSRVPRQSLDTGVVVLQPNPAGPGSLWTSLDWRVTFQDPFPGGDELSGVPSYLELGIGTDGSIDERLTMAQDIRFQLGYPVIDVELTKEQIDYFITKAVQELRQRSAIAYRRGFFFLTIAPETQRYKLTNKAAGYDHIVNIMGVYRMTSAFLSSAHGAGVYGQIVLQHLYNMGTFDLLSYHIISDYIEEMEILFAARVVYTWHEESRELFLHHRFPFSERMVLIEASVERTEQDLMSDRYTMPWIRRYALAQSRIALAEIRGKYSTLPGAGGSVTLNASDLRAAGVEEIKLCLEDIENYSADYPEEFGAGVSLILG